MTARRGKLSAWLKRPLIEKVGSIIHRSIALRDRVYEKSRGIDFGGYVAQQDFVTPFATAVAHATWYDGLSTITLRMILREIEKMGMSFDSFVDIGSGKGKVCIYVEKLARFRDVVGVEFSLPLIETARRNQQRARLSKAVFVHADAATFTLPNKNSVVFLFNPFDEFVFESFIGNNLTHFKEHRSIIAYASDHQRHVLIREGFETICRNQTPNFSIYKYSP